MYAEGARHDHPEPNYSVLDQPSKINSFVVATGENPLDQKLKKVKQKFVLPTGKTVAKPSKRAQKEKRNLLN